MKFNLSEKLKKIESSNCNYFLTLVQNQRRVGSLISNSNAIRKRKKVICSIRRFTQKKAI